MNRPMMMIRYCLTNFSFILGSIQIYVHARIGYSQFQTYVKICNGRQG